MSYTYPTQWGTLYTFKTYNFTCPDKIISFKCVPNLPWIKLRKTYLSAFEGIGFYIDLIITREVANHYSFHFFWILKQI